MAGDPALPRHRGRPPGERARPRPPRPRRAPRPADRSRAGLPSRPRDGARAGRRAVAPPAPRGPGGGLGARAPLLRLSRPLHRDLPRLRPRSRRLLPRRPGLSPLLVPSRVGRARLPRGRRLDRLAAPRRRSAPARAKRDRARDPGSPRRHRGDRLSPGGGAHRGDRPAVRGLVLRRLDAVPRPARGGRGGHAASPRALGRPRGALLGLLRPDRGNRPPPHGRRAGAARVAPAQDPWPARPLPRGTRSARASAPHLGSAARRGHLRPLRPVHGGVPRDGGRQAARSPARGPGNAPGDARGSPARGPGQPRGGVVLHDLRGVRPRVPLRDRGPGQARRPQAHARGDGRRRCRHGPGARGDRGARESVRRRAGRSSRVGRGPRGARAPARRDDRRALLGRLRRGLRPSRAAHRAGHRTAPASGGRGVRDTRLRRDLHRGSGAADRRRGRVPRGRWPRGGNARRRPVPSAS